MNNNVENNKENWGQLTFTLEQRDKPTLIVISVDSYSIQKQIYNKLNKKFSEYKFYDLDLSTKSIVSLNNAFVKNLPKSVLNSKTVEYIVNVFGLENSLFKIQNKEIKQSSLIPQLNFERELLFRGFPFITIIWTDTFTVNEFKKKAKDLWDWISYYFDFKTYDQNQEDIIDYSIGKVFIAYARQDYEIAKKLSKDIKHTGFDTWIDIEEVVQGQNWKLEINKAIKKSSYFLVLISSNSLNKNDYVHKEVKIALDLSDALPSSQIFIIPVYIQPCEPIENRFKEFHGVNLYPCYETGLKKILHVLSIRKTKNNSFKSFHGLDELNQRDKSEIIKRINHLQQRYDQIRLDTRLTERIIREKVNIQKLLAQEYIQLKDYKKAEQALRIALRLVEQIKGLEYEKEDVLFLLNQVFYKPE